MGRKVKIAAACLLGCVAALLLLVNFGGAALLNLLSSSDVYEAEIGIAYGDSSRQVLDVYTPKEAGGPSPVVVFFYGGGWESGDRADYAFVASSLAREGYTVVIPDYRVYPEVTYPAFVEDAAAAVAWVQAHIASRGGDPGRVAVGGHSAGGYLAAMVAFAPDPLRAAGGNREGLSGMFGIAGAYDFLPFDEGSVLHEIFPEPLQRESQPVNRIEDGTVLAPAFLLHGKDDQTVWLRNTENLAARLIEAGGDVGMITYPNASHRRIIAGLAPGLDFVASTRTNLLIWLAGTLGPE